MNDMVQDLQGYVPKVLGGGIYPEMQEFYHKEQITPSEFLSQSKIKVLNAKTPFDARYEKREESDALNLGSVVHAIILGKGTDFIVSPFDEYRTKEAKAWKIDVQENGLIPIKEALRQEAEIMARKAMRDFAKELPQAPFKECEKECPFFWEEDGVWCGGSMDLFHKGSGIIIDPKITSYVHDPINQIMKMGWDIQAAWYKRGIGKIFPELEGKVRFINLLISPKAPYTTRFIEIGNGWTMARERDCLRALNIWKECLANNEWKGYEGIETLLMPEWAIRQQYEREMEENGENI